MASKNIETKEDLEYFSKTNYYDKYCEEIFERSETIQTNLNNFDKDMQKEKDNSRSL